MEWNRNGNGNGNGNARCEGERATRTDKKRGEVTGTRTAQSNHQAVQFLTAGRTGQEDLHIACEILRLYKHNRSMLDKSYIPRKTACATAVVLLWCRIKCYQTSLIID